MENILFTEKFNPQNWDQFVGNSTAVEKIKSWALAWSQGKPQKALFVHGSSGVGKTSLAYLLAKEMDWDIFELNASNLRSKQVIDRIGQAAAYNATFSNKRRLILLDEVDATSRVDRGAYAAMNAIAKQSANPVILTAIDIYGNQKMAPLRQASDLTPLKKINYLSIASYLKKLCTQENIAFDEEAIKTLAKRCDGDMRAVLLDLQLLSNEKITFPKVEELSSRERSENIFNSMRKIFRAKDIPKVKDAVNKAEIDYRMLNNWMEENIPREFKGTDISNAFDFFSKGDVFNGRIIKTQYYGFLRYSIDLMTACSVLSRSQDYHDWVPYAFPGIMRKGGARSARLLRKKISTKIGRVVHSSSKLAGQNELPLLQVLMKDKEKAPKLAYAFDFDKDEIAFLMNTKPETKKVEKVFEEAQLVKAQRDRRPKFVKQREKEKLNSEKKSDTEETLNQQTKLF